MHLKIKEIVEASNSLIFDMGACQNIVDLELIKPHIDEFKEKFHAKSKHTVDINLINTYHNLLLEIFDFTKMNLEFEKRMKYK